MRSAADAHSCPCPVQNLNVPRGACGRRPVGKGGSCSGDWQHPGAGVPAQLLGAPEPLERSLPEHPAAHATQSRRMNHSGHHTSPGHVRGIIGDVSTLTHGVPVARDLWQARLCAGRVTAGLRLRSRLTCGGERGRPLEESEDDTD